MKLKEYQQTAERKITKATDPGIFLCWRTHFFKGKRKAVARTKAIVA
jgi:hypothetical protein